MVDNNIGVFFFTAVFYSSSTYYEALPIRSESYDDAAQELTVLSTPARQHLNCRFLKKESHIAQ